MYRHKRKLRMHRPLRSLHGAVWMIGLAILFLTGGWFPGIFVLIGISMVLESLSAGLNPPPFEGSELPRPPAIPRPVVPPPSVVTPPQPFHQPAQTSAPRVAQLPARCPHCGGPVHKEEVKWNGVSSVVCAYCGSTLPISMR